MQLTILGSAGFVPHGGRETCCALLRDGSQALLIDAGSGVRRLVEQPELLAGVERLDVLLTHFHLDHTVGLSYLLAAELPGRTCLHGPGLALYGIATDDILSRTYSRPQSAMVLSDIGDVAEIEPPATRIGAFELRLRRQNRHRDPTLGLRLGESFAYCTDTASDEGTIPFVRGVGVLLHEVWASARSPIDADSHTTAAAAAEIAAAAGAARLVFIHRNPKLPDYAPLVAEARPRFPASEAAEDGLVIEL
jgi:ribonuclease Z